MVSSRCRQTCSFASAVLASRTAAADASAALSEACADASAASAALRASRTVSLPVRRCSNEL